MLAFAFLTMLTSLGATVTVMDWWNRDKVPPVMTVSSTSTPSAEVATPPPTAPPRLQQEPAISQAPLPANPLPAATVSPDEDFVPPKLLKRVEPEYTRDAQVRRIEGIVALRLFVTPNGNVRKIKVIRRLDTGLDRNAIEAISHWHYAPATQNGHAVTAQITEEISFHLP
jgi:TonB family protein